METLHPKITKSDIGDKSNIRVESGLVTDNTTQSIKGATAQFHNAHRTRLAFFYTLRLRSILIQSIIWWIDHDWVMDCYLTGKNCEQYLEQVTFLFPFFIGQ